jgi:hypothetical protein
MVRNARTRSKAEGMGWGGECDGREEKVVVIRGRRLGWKV